MATVLVVVASIASTLGFAGTFADLGFVPAAAVGAVGPAVIAVAGARRRLLLGESLALSAAVFVALGPVATHGIHGSFSYGSFVGALVHSWANLLSSPAPADLTPSLAVVPYTLAWLSSIIGTELAQRQEHGTIALVGPVAATVMAAPLTVEHRTIALAQGAALAGCLLTLGLAGSISRPGPRVESRATGPRFGVATLARATAGVGTIGVVLSLGIVLGPRLPFVDLDDRVDLRHHRDRPWEPLSVPSPLVSFKASLKEGRSGDVVFVVESDRAVQRWSVAVLDAYDGVVWAVADDDTGVDAASATARFVPVDTVAPTPPSGVSMDDPVEYHLTIGDLDQPWIPVAGWPSQVRSSTTEDLRLHQGTGTLASPTGLRPGDDFAVTAYLRPELDPAELAHLVLEPSGDGRSLDLVPPGLRNLAGDLFEGETGMGRALAISEHLVHRGFYDHGPSARPGHSLARLEEFLADPERTIGYGEHYAAAAAVLMRIGDIPGRVVVGYLVPQDRYLDGRAEVFADDLAAWTEIRTAEHGWVPLPVTPDRSREPRDEDLGISTREIAVPNPPPPPPPAPDTAPPAQREDVDDSDEPTEDGSDRNAGLAVPRPMLVGATGIGVPLTVAGVPAAAVIGAKRHRTTRRRRGSPAERVDGAWREMLDRFREAGWALDDASTPTEAVTLLAGGARPDVVPTDHADHGDHGDHGDQIGSLAALAAVVDRAAFHPEPPDEAQAEAAWQHCDTVVARLRRSHGRWGRLCMHTDPRTLLGPAARPRKGGPR